ncbi:MAG: CpsD/CapB family tyrosine-protein kinase [bacterium]|nr:CpsD/CapB family tyrosine-protein kinase [bacterium]
MNQPKVRLQKSEKQDYAFEEAIKTLRTNIQFSGSNKKVILFTSAVAHEGKSSLAFETAFSLSQIGKKVLLVDTDMWKSVLTSRYQFDKEVKGLSQYLSGQEKLEQVIYATNFENFDVLAAGPFAPNPTNLLEEALFGELIKTQREKYDYIIIDTPPLGTVIDAAVSAKHCDGAVLVLEAGETSYKMAQKTKRQLERTACPILGVVLNKVNMKKGSYYGSYYRKYNSYYEK